MPRAIAQSDDGVRGDAGTSAAKMCGRCVAGIAAVILLGAAALMEPSDLLARAGAADPRMPRDPARGAVVTALGELLRDCHLVLAIHQRGPSPYLEVALWLKDEREPGVLNAEEFVLLCHSQVLQTITTYTFSAEQAQGASAQGATTSLELTEAATRGFCDRWRSDPAVEQRVLAAGISDLQVEELAVQSRQVNSPMRASGPKVRLSLTWAVQMTDSLEEASVVLEAPIAAQDALRVGTAGAD